MRTFTPAERDFILAHLKEDAAKLMLQASRYPGLPMLEMVQQIQARQKAASKLPTWSAHPEVVFPVMVSVEQSSSEVTAAFKASLVTGKLLVDLTGGFGVDSYFFSKQFEQVLHVEQNNNLQEIAAHNFRLLGATSIESINSTAEDFLTGFNGYADVMYLDPARRGNSNEKLHLLQDCEPDILNLLPTLFRKSKTILLKTSPMLDIDLAIAQLGCVAKLWVLAVQNEVKEVLYLLQENAPDPAAVERTAVNLLTDGSQQIHFTKTAEDNASVSFADPKAYLYEPNGAILKAGAYRFVAQQYKAGKLHPNSHLYTSSQLIADFPGRKFSCAGSYRYSKKELLKLLPGKKANITTRNFPESVAEIRKKTSLKEGGDVYLFFTTDMHQKPLVLFCRKV